MNTIYQKNITALRLRNPHLADEIDRTIVPESYVFSPSRNGAPNIRIHKNNQEYLYHSTYDPQKEAVKSIEHYYQTYEQDCLDAAFGFVVGFGFGYQVYALVNKINWLRELIIVEPDLRVLRVVLEHQDLTEILLHPNMSLIAGDVTLDKLRAIRGAQWLNLGGIIGIPWLQLDALHPGYYESFRKVVAGFIAEKNLVKNTYLTSGRVQVENKFRNIPSMFTYPPVNDLFGKFEDVPFVCIAAGPSLNSYLDDLKKIRDKSVFIAADTAFKVLIENGIKPDIITAADPLPHKFRFFEQNPELTRDVLLIAGTSTYPGLLACWLGPVRLVFQGNHLFKFFFEELAYPGIEEIPDIFTVALASLVNADRMGGNPIILVGQDLRVGETDHAQGTSLNRAIEFIEKEGRSYARTQRPDGTYKDTEVFHVPDYTGQLVPTWKNFLFYIKSFEEYISKSEKKIFNLTETGACIRGVQRVKLEDISDYFKQPVCCECIHVGQQSTQPQGIETARYHVRHMYNASSAAHSRLASVLATVRSLADNPFQTKYTYLNKEISAFYADLPQLAKLVDLHITKEVLRHCREGFNNYPGMPDTHKYRNKYRSSVRMVFALQRGVRRLQENLLHTGLLSIETQ